jgi:hypothetical protein
MDQILFEVIIKVLREEGFDAQYLDLLGPCIIIQCPGEILVCRTWKSLFTATDYILQEKRTKMITKSSSE